MNHAQVIHAGMESLEEIIKRIEIVLKARPPTSDNPEGPFSFINDVSVISQIEPICYAQAKAYDCLFDGERRAWDKKEPELARLRLIRVRIVADACTGATINEIKNKKVRHALVHYDEHLTKVLIENPNHFWMKDLIMTHRKMINNGNWKSRTFTRVILYEENKLFMLGEELNFGALLKECYELLLRLKMADTMRSGIWIS